MLHLKHLNHKYGSDRILYKTAEGKFTIPRVTVRVQLDGTSSNRISDIQVRQIDSCTISEVLSFFGQTNICIKCSCSELLMLMISFFFSLYERYPVPNVFAAPIKLKVKVQCDVSIDHKMSVLIIIYCKFYLRAVIRFLLANNETSTEVRKKN